jgi:four helix bundle protein
MYKTFKEMPIWKEAMSVAEKVFATTENLPKKEDYGFTSQIRRAALSISGNIAEAYGRNHTSDKINFYYMARGSVTEVQSHLEYGKRVGYMDKNKASEIDDSLTRLYNDLNKVVVTLRNNGNSTKKGGNKR